MTAAPSTAAVGEQSVEVAGGPLAYLKGGSGPPLLVLHHEIGNPGWSAFYAALAQQRTILVPDLPGYGNSERPAWARDVRDLATLVHLFLDRLGVSWLELVGLGFGGWVAAEMAVMAQSRFGALALVNPYGLKPRSGEIMDQFLIGHEDFVRAGFHDPAAFERKFTDLPSVDQLEAWDVHREMTTRIAWKPYMFSHSLPALLGEVRVPALIVGCDDDRIAPIDCARHYAELLPNASLRILAETGHFAEMERPDELARLVTDFFNDHGRHD